MCLEARFVDAQFDLIEALLLSPPVRSFPELSLSPAFRRQWHSLYATLKAGDQDLNWLERYFIQLVSTQGPQMFSLDGTSWLQPAAKTMPDQQYVYSPAQQMSRECGGKSRSPELLLAPSAYR